MQVDAIAVELRPRPMWEAADLGVRMVQVNARSMWATCGPLFAVVFVLALSTVEIAPWLPVLLLFWLKPWLGRSILFVLSRAAFGQATRFGDLWRARGEVWGSQLLGSLLWRRLSPWRAFTQPIYQLEGQRGASRRQRRAQLLRGQRSAAGGVQLAFAYVQAILVTGVLSMAVWFAPDEARGDVIQWITRDEGLGAALATSAAYALLIALVEPFHVAAGFAMYLNRRVQLEAWDIEQEFRRAF